MAPGFAAMGWVVERLAFLHRELPAPAPGGTHGAELRVEPFEATPPAAHGVAGRVDLGRPADFTLDRGAGGGAPRHARRGRLPWTASRPASPRSRPHGDAVEVELVFCLPERRNGGLGGALVATALETAHAEGARHALIEADDEGDAKRLYERLGFRTVWVRHSFTRKPAP